MQLSDYEDNLFYAKRKIDSLKQELQKDYEAYFDLKYLNKTTQVAEIQAELDERTALVEYYVYDSTISVFMISKEDFEVISIEGTEGIIEMIKNFQIAINNQNKSEYINKSHQLYEQLVAPVLQLVDKDYLIIVPDKELWHLNFDLLITELGKDKDYRELSYLLRTKEISYANSATSLFMK